MSIPESIESTLAHIELIRSKRDRLEEAQRHAEIQLSLACGRERLDLEALIELRRRWQQVALVGFISKWNKAVPYMSLSSLRWEQLWQPNGPNGSWNGPWPLDANDPRPSKRVSVVYVLIDPDMKVCYVGSTGNFLQRLKAHQRDKDFCWWLAYPSENRKHAFKLERDLLKIHKPYLNKIGGRR